MCTSELFVEDDLNNFWVNVEMIPFHTCWEWIGGVNKHTGYGQLTYKSKAKLAHRLSYELHKGSIPEKQVVMHTCDNKTCVNPEHLKLGTQADNMRDMSVKNRSLRGSKNPTAKLTEKRVVCIRADNSSTNEELAGKFNVDKTLIRLIKSKKIWKHV